MSKSVNGVVIALIMICLFISIGVESSLRNRCFNIVHHDRCIEKECKSTCLKMYPQSFIENKCVAAPGGPFKGRGQCACEHRCPK
ncbi:hypothetical protein EUTSA_v10028008mg [Eutrema salsugineum]|uniref:Defensin-like protein n=1 Tax=Eutrema salsugineum TaxID=72664 RepID=V4LSL9_EUTSA|nr:hypothetical protein EUTSA_v10028008mg [Eutrema salsugineum]